MHDKIFIQPFYYFGAMRSAYWSNKEGEVLESAFSYYNRAIDIREPQIFYVEYYRKFIIPGFLKEPRTKVLLDRLIAS